MAEHIARIGKEVKGRYVEVTASVSNFVPKPHTPYQWNGMQTREYLQWAGDYMRKRRRLRSVQIKQHDIECSLLEGVLTRGDRRIAPALEEAWRRGCRLGRRTYRIAGRGILLLAIHACAVPLGGGHPRGADRRRRRRDHGVVGIFPQDKHRDEHLPYLWACASALAVSGPRRCWREVR